MNEINDPILQLADRQTSEGGVPERMPDVFSLYQSTIDDLRAIDQANPDIAEASQAMGDLIAKRQLQLAALLDKNTPEG